MGEVRRLGVSDAAAYHGIRAEMLLDTPGSFASSPGDDGARDLAFVEKILSPGTNGVFGLFDDAEVCQSVAGFIRFEKLKRRHVGEIWGVYTRPSGRRQGAAKRVMRGIIDYAVSLDGLEQIELSVSAEAPAAQALYESLGFQIWGREPRALLIGDQRPDEVHMWLPIER